MIVSTAVETRVSASTTAAQPSTSAITSTTTIPSPRRITMAFTGDTLVHSPLWRRAELNAAGIRLRLPADARALAAGARACRPRGMSPRNTDRARGRSVVDRPDLRGAGRGRRRFGGGRLRPLLDGQQPHVGSRHGRDRPHRRHARIGRHRAVRDGAYASRRSHHGCSTSPASPSRTCRTRFPTTASGRRPVRSGDRP